MSARADHVKLSVGQFAEQFRNAMIPLSTTFSYFCASVPLTEEDLKEYLEEPIAALPPAIASVLPKISIMLVPYLERVDGSKNVPASEFVCTERPPDNRQFWASQVQIGNEAILLFALKDQEVAEYHYRFYRMIASLISERWAEDAQSSFSSLLREELNATVHGEVDEESWREKQGLLRRQSNVRRETKLFRDYAHASFIDTLTLYLHGICCDIDVETGPRQLASRYLRRRLNLLYALYPPPEGYAVLPEHLKESS
ncbi:MAG: hypothetical protein ABSH09_08335 [Bryobacteraceae bacterium]|jgi:hypothetical protein